MAFQGVLGGALAEHPKTHHGMEQQIGSTEFTQTVTGTAHPGGATDEFPASLSPSCSSRCCSRSPARRRSAKEIGDAVGGADYTAVAMTIKRFEQKAASNANLRRHMKQIKAQCEM